MRAPNAGLLRGRLEAASKTLAEKPAVDLFRRAARPPPQAARGYRTARMRVAALDPPEDAFSHKRPLAALYELKPCKGNPQ